MADFSPDELSLKFIGIIALRVLWYSLQSSNPKLNIHIYIHEFPWYYFYSPLKESETDDKKN